MTPARKPPICIIAENLPVRAGRRVKLVEAYQDTAVVYRTSGWGWQGHRDH